MANVTSTRRTRKPPKYCLHKATGQAYVRLNGRDHYLGKHGSSESLQKYSALIAEDAAGAVIVNANRATPQSGLSITEIILAYRKHAAKYYVKDGKPTDEVACIKSALRDLLNLYPDLPADNFGPIAMKAVRQKMVEAGWTRRFCNQSVGRIRRMFKWAVESELIEPTVLMKLQAVAPLMPGRSDAREHTPRHSVPQETIEKIKRKVPERTRDMIDLWLLTGARPGELLKLTPEMIDRKTYKSKGVWIAELKDHKTAYRGKQRILVFGKKSQAILSRYITVAPSARLFNVTRATVSHSMKMACEELGIPVVTPHWLRHTAATRVRQNYGLDAAQVTLGHSKADITELYAGLDLEKAIMVARDAG